MSFASFTIAYVDFVDVDLILNNVRNKRQLTLNAFKMQPKSMKITTVRDYICVIHLYFVALLVGVRAVIKTK